MHIPDGYLSPATCAVTYAAVLPFWYFAFARLRRRLHTRMLPQLALFAAFSFVIMMFNLPLPGGTSGHAVGVAIATIVLGPWASLVAVSMALLIQALFFGDGGLTTFGANCLNMAVVGSFVAHWTYSLCAGRAAPDARRRVGAAAVAGYLALNAAALLTAIEFGIQPTLFHDTAGTPLYAPYPLSVAVPAMMAGHLGCAGLAELFITAGLLAWLQRAHSSLLDAATPPPATAVSAWSLTRKLWLGLAALMIVSPLGLLAAGTAWGEWGAEDFTNPAARQEIAQASAGQMPPAAAPQGLAHLAGLWQAPVPDYAPSFLQHAQLGYVFSAVLGTGLILLALWLLTWVLGRRAAARAG